MVSESRRSRRFLAILAALTLAVSAVACGSSPSLSPTSPTPLTGVPGFVLAPASELAPSSEQEPVSTTRDTAAITGTVTEPSGARVWGATVTVLDGPNVGTAVGTNSEGIYTFPALEIGNTNFSVTADTYQETRAGVYVNGTNTINFTLTRATVSLSGTVSSSAGGRIGGATIKVLDGPQKDTTVTTGSNGDYRFPSLTAGNTNFVVTASGYYDDGRGVFVNGLNSLNFTMTVDPVETASITISATRLTGGRGAPSQEWELVASSSSFSTYDWDFGDGNSASASTRIERHVYRGAGTKTVTVRANHSNGTYVDGTLELDLDSD